MYVTTCSDSALLFLLFFWQLEEKQWKQLLSSKFDAFQQRNKSIDIRERIVKWNGSDADNITTKIQLNENQPWILSSDRSHVNLHKRLFSPKIQILDEHSHRWYGMIVVLLAVPDHQEWEFSPWNCRMNLNDRSPRRKYETKSFIRTIDFFLNQIVKILG